jgi:hypothetical protein
VGGNGVAGFGFPAVTLNEVGDDQFGGNVTLGEIDLGLLAVEFALTE